MAKRAVEVPPWVSLDPSSGAPYYRQLYDGMRHAILSGLLSSGTRLPSTRTLATELGVSRTTVVTAFEGLLAEGYLEGKVGSGTFVAKSLPDDSLSVAFEASREPGPARSGRGLSGRGTLLAATPATAVRDRGSPRAFRPGVPALDEFPDAVWRRILNNAWRRPSGGLLGYGDSAGYAPLRKAIAGYLGASRAVRCVPEQVIVVSGSQQHSTSRHRYSSIPATPCGSRIPATWEPAARSPAPAPVSCPCRWTGKGSRLRRVSSASLAPGSPA